MRISFAGGGSDIKEFSAVYGGAVCNATISMYVHVRLSVSSKGEHALVSKDLGIEESYNTNDLSLEKSRLKLHVGVLSYFLSYEKDGRHFDVETFSEAPVCSGLGSSSTIVVAMIAAFNSFYKANLSNEEIAHLAFFIERDVCGFPGGQQDQLSAVFGGFCLHEFHTSGLTSSVSLKIHKNFKSLLDSKSLLYFTGVSRYSDTIIRSQKELILDKERAKTFSSLRDNAYEMSSCIERGDLTKFIDLLNKGWLEKKKTSGMVSNSSIDSIIAIHERLGCEAVKVCGAGGGGFVFSLFPNDKISETISELNMELGKVFNFSFVDEGVRTWWKQR